jgi:O-antigen/teichoic acid export membrane protein
VSVAQVMVLLAGAGLPVLAALTLCGGLASLVVYRGQVRRTFPEVAVSRRHADRATARRLLSLGWRNSVTGVAGTLAFGSDILLVGLLLDPRAAAAYAIAMKVQSLMKNIAGGLTGSLGPTHAHAAANLGPERRFRLFSLSVHLSLVLMLCATVTVAFYAHPLLALWLGTVPPHASAVLVLLCAVLLLQMPGFSAYTLLIAAERVGELVGPVVVAALCNVVLSVVLTLHFGITGPALGSLLTVVFFDAVYLPWRVCRLLDVGFASFNKSVLRPLLLPTLVLVAMLAAGRSVVSTGPAILVAGALACGGFIATWWASEAARDVRQLFQRPSLGAAI